MAENVPQWGKGVSLLIPSWFGDGTLLGVFVHLDTDLLAAFLESHALPIDHMRLTTQ